MATGQTELAGDKRPLPMILTGGAYRVYIPTRLVAFRKRHVGRSLIAQGIHALFLKDCMCRFCSRECAF